MLVLQRKASLRLRCERYTACYAVDSSALPSAPVRRLAPALAARSTLRCNIKLLVRDSIYGKRYMRTKPQREAGRLIIVCGLPGSGKTTHAKQLEDRLRAIRFAPDEWMEALGIDL